MAKSDANPATKTGFFAGLPKSGMALDMVKVYAALMMVVDHINTVLLQGSETIMMMIGRGAFPLFAYATACAIYRAQDKNKDPSQYLWIMLIFGIISEPFNQMAFLHDKGNIFITLALGAALATKFESLKPIYQYLSCVFALATLLIPSGWEYGIVGVMLPPCILMMLRGHKPWGWILLVMVMAVNLGGLDGDFSDDRWIFGIIAVGGAAVFFSAMAVFMSMSIKGDKRILSRYALHIFYPAHLALLVAINYIWTVMNPVGLP